MKIKLLLIVLSIVALSSCKTKSLYTRMDESRLEAVSWCNTNVPIIIKQGETKTIIDTVTEAGDTVRIEVPCPDGTKAVVNCPPSKIRTVTKKVVQHDTISDTRAAESERLLRLKSDEENSKLKGTIVVKDDQIKEEKEKSKTRMYWIIGLSVLLAGSAYMNIRKLFPV